MMRPNHHTQHATSEVSLGELVAIGLMAEDVSLPVMIKPEIADINLRGWLSRNREPVLDLLSKHAGILFRGFDINPENELEAIVKTISSDLLEYHYRSTPRTQVKGKIYTSTEYPPNQSIPLHNEEAYTTCWPMKLWFACVIPAAVGGETPLVDSRIIYQKIPPSIRERFAAKRLLYVRNYTKHLDLTWQDVFQTNQASEVENFCKKLGIEYEWLNDDHLRTKQLCQAVAKHPLTNEMVWFNQAHLFHISALDQEVRTALIEEVGQDNLPRHVYYGDGSEIDDHDLNTIREIYQQEMIKFSWQQNDIVLVDNMLAAHGRMPFSGERKIIVAMTEEHISSISQ